MTLVTIASIYSAFAGREARGVSPAYQRLADAVARDRTLLALLAELPPAKRQPNLLFAVVRLLDGPVAAPEPFREFVAQNWARIAPEMLGRATQTNEVGRCAALLPVLATLPPPLALINVGASAGLCLYPDRYSYRYRSPGRNPPHLVGSTAPVLDCETTGLTPPTTRPTVVWRAGLDINPLDVDDAGDVAWLEALIWPEQAHRRERLRAAIAIARAEPPRLVRGDGLTALPGLAAEAPAGATLVVYHTSVLYQVPPPDRAQFLDLVRSLPGHWVSIETPDVVDVGELPPPPDDRLHNVLALDGTPLAWVRGHGQALTWFGPGTARH
jgi:Uncharacterized protein conserved in bacteria (DUF2332)